MGSAWFLAFGDIKRRRLWGSFGLASSLDHLHPARRYLQETVWNHPGRAIETAASLRMVSVAKRINMKTFSNLR
jgi:hypothetical protein